MGHHSNNCSGHDSHCVIDVVKGIVKAQHKVAEASEDTCTTSCDRSIADLLSPARENGNRSRHNTIPFMLFCKSSCKPFVGSGVLRSDERFRCIESPVFRAKGFVGRSETCVRLELLTPVRSRGSSGGSHGQTKDGDANDLGGQRDKHGHEQGCDCGCGSRSACDFFPSSGVRSFRATGICLTIDLHAFFGITCLDPITIR